MKMLCKNIMRNAYIKYIFVLFTQTTAYMFITFEVYQVLNPNYNNGDPS